MTPFDADGEAFSRCLQEDKTDLVGAFRMLFYGQDTNAVAHLAVDAVFQEDGTVSGGVSGSFEVGETVKLNLGKYRTIWAAV